MAAYTGFLIFPAMFVAPIALYAAVPGYYDLSTRSTALPTPSSWAEPAVDNGDAGAAQDPERISQIATVKGIAANHGSSFLYIASPPKGGHLIVHETFSSRSKYKTITPIIDIEQDDLVIDCSYVRSVEDAATVSVGTYCRGRSAASLESIEDAVGDEPLLTYSPSLPWLDRARDIVDCEQPTGLTYAGHYFIRCQGGEEDETTESLSIRVLSPDYRLIFSMDEFEFVPTGRADSQDVLIFWAFRRDSSYEIIEKTLP
jgi:hypothetical protein